MQATNFEAEFASASPAHGANKHSVQGRVLMTSPWGRGGGFVRCCRATMSHKNKTKHFGRLDYCSCMLKQRYWGEQARLCWAIRWRSTIISGGRAGAPPAAR